MGGDAPLRGYAENDERVRLRLGEATGDRREIAAGAGVVLEYDAMGRPRRRPLEAEPIRPPRVGMPVGFGIGDDVDDERLERREQTRQ
jgi:hypothetical protein